MRKKILLFITIISICIGLFLPSFSIGQTKDEFLLSQKDGNLILEIAQSEVSKLIPSSRIFNYSSEEQAALTIFRYATRRVIIDFLPGFITTETIKGIIKIVGFISNITETSVKELLEQVERQTIKEANKLALAWFFDEEIKTASGSIKNSSTGTDFQYVIIYKGIDQNSAEIVIEFSSSYFVNPPRAVSSIGGYSGFVGDSPYTDKLDPFVIRISMMIEKYLFGWKVSNSANTKIEVEFPDEVPRLELAKELPYPIEEQRTKLVNFLITVKKVVDALGDMGIDTSAIIGKVVDMANGLAYNVSTFISQIVTRGGAGVGLEDDIELQDKDIGVEDILLTENILQELITIETIAPQLTQEKQENTNLDQVTTESLEVVVEEKLDEIEKEDGKKEELLEQQEVEKKDEQLQETPSASTQCADTSSAFQATAVLFNEIAWMGTTNSASDEWIELKNITNQEINLAGWQLMDKAGQISVIFQNEHTVSAQAFFILERTDDTSIPNVSADIIYTGALSNTKEALYLFDGDCVLQDRVVAEPKWPAGLSSVRQTLERRVDNTWQTSSSTDGTPNAPNSSGYVEAQQPPISTSSGSGSTGSSGGGGTPPSVVTYPKILISEIQTEGETVKDEFVELYNPNDSDVDLDGWLLKKKTSGGTESNLVSASAFSGTLSVNGYFLITPQFNEDGSPNFTGTETPDLYYSGRTYSFAANNTILLYNPNGELVDKVGFGLAQDFEGALALNPLANQSLSRIWDETNQTYYDRDDNSIDFEVHNPVTPNARNTNLEPEPDPEPEPELEIQDTTLPQVSFGVLSETQSTVYFTLSWTGEDPVGETEPSGIDKFYLQYSVTPSADGVFLQYEENDVWQSWQQDQAGELIFDAASTSLSLWGQDGVEYNFQIKAKDIAGNESALSTTQTQLNLAKSVVINEVAWMGTNASTSDEWIELYNTSEEEINLTDWSIYGANTGVCLNFADADNYEEGGENSGFIIAAGEYLIYANDENTVMEHIMGLSVNIANVWDVAIGLNNLSPGILRLFNQQDCTEGLVDEVGLSTGTWFAGDNIRKQTMERIEATSSGSDSLNWSSNNLITHNGRDSDNTYINGTPGQENSLSLAETQVQGLRLTEFDNVTLTILGSPYSILNGQIIPSGKTLVIEPGVTINFKSGDGSLRIDGTLTAIGQSGKTITFQSSVAGPWCGMHFTSTSVNSEITFGLIDNASIRAAGCSVTGPRYVVWVEDSDITMKNTTIQNGDWRYKLHLDNSNSTLDSVTISGANNPGDPDASAILITGGSPTITNSTFSDNHIGIRNKFPSGTPTITNNTFTNNTYPIKFTSSAGTVSGNTASNNTYNGIYMNGAATTDLTWQAGTLPYVVNQFRVYQDKTLTIQAGTKVKFVSSPYRGPGLTIQGSLISQGTSDAPVVFTAVSDDSVGGATLGDGGRITNSWKYLRFTSTSTGSSLTHTILKFGGNTDNEGALYLDNSDITLDNITIQDSFSSAIYANASTMTGSNLTLTDNRYGFYIKGGICPVLTNVTRIGGNQFHPSSQCNP